MSLTIEILDQDGDRYIDEHEAICGVNFVDNQVNLTDLAVI